MNATKTVFPTERLNLSGSTLKLVAIVTMLIDHAAVALIIRMMVYANRQGDRASFDALRQVYYISRQIGRTAFPIYCFLLTEGLQYTKNKWRYLARLGVFALISEIPFDLAFHSKILEFTDQNVFFTLAIGLLVIILLQEIGQSGTQKPGSDICKIALSVVIVAAGFALAHWMETDYSWKGVACIVLFYLLRRHREEQLMAGYLAFVLLLQEFWAFPAFLLLGFYRGRKGFSCKYFFYAFYPAHLLALYFVSFAMGLSDISPLK